MKPRHECPRCHWRYPESVEFNPVVGSVRTGPICGICALEVVNEVHGSAMIRFQGEMAEFMRQDAVNARQSGAAFPPKK